MADLNPVALIEIYNDQELFGYCTYFGDSVTWPLPASIGRPGSAYAGFALDMTGQYLCQQPVNVWQDAGETQWARAGGTWTHGTDQSTGKQFLIQSAPTGDYSAASLWARADEEGVTLGLFLAGAVSSAVSPVTYVQFADAMRLVFAAGQSIRVQALVASVWTDTGVTAASLGECEAYLDSVNRRVLLSVDAQTDPAWTQAINGGPSPNRVCISINGGDAVLTLPAATVPGGNIVLSGNDRKLGASLALCRYTPTGNIALAAQTRPDAFVGTPVQTLIGYVPPYGGITPSATPTGNTVTGALALSVVEGGMDGTSLPSLALRSCYLAALELDFVPVEVAPLSDPDKVTYEPVLCEFLDNWQQDQNTRRYSGKIEFMDTQGAFAPGADGILPAVRAFKLYMGQAPAGASFSAGDFTPDDLTLVGTGYTGLADDGFSWEVTGSLYTVSVSLSDRLTMAEQRACMYQVAYDGTNHKWAQGRLARRYGYTSGDLNFDEGTKYQDGEYLLSYGTAIAPLFQPQPSETLMQMAQEIRAEGGDIDETTEQIQPMTFGTTSDGKLDYFAMPVGVAQVVSGNSDATTGLTPVQAFSATPGFAEDGTPLLNELLGTFRTTASLTNIRSGAVFEGIDQQTGGVCVGFYQDIALYTNNNKFGYIGRLPNNYVQISKRINSQAVADRQAKLAQVLFRFPAVRAYPTGFLQASLAALTVISVTEPGTQGTTDPVLYYCSMVRHLTLTRATGQRIYREGSTQIGARLLGEP